MRKMRIVLTFLAVIVMLSASAQEIRYCGQTQATEALFAKYPHLRHENEQSQTDFQAAYEERLANRANRGGGDEEVYIIPVVFHIIHDNGEENISDEQVYSAVEILNRDFAMENEDIEDVVDAFSDLPQPINIEFRLAKRDPQGNCTKGINRVESALTYQGDQDMKDLIQWPTDMYMNVWVCADAGGAAGYTYLPANWLENSPQFDGIVLLHDYTGAIGTSNTFRSRTLTHECGHWLNLPHLWGGSNTPGVAANCDMDDGIPDTPETIGWTSCTLDGESCGSLDNVQNYMEYSYCSRMFTTDQKERMRQAAESNTAFRNDLWQQSNLEATGVLEESILCAAEFRADQQIVCQGTEIQFFDESFHGIQEWNWDFGTFTVSGTDEEVHKNPIVMFDEPGVYDVTLTVSDGIDSIEETKEAFITVLPMDALDAPFVEGFEAGIASETWFIENQHNNVTWELTDVAAATGDQCVRIRNRNNTIEYSRDYLTSSTMDLTGASFATITYKYAYCNRPDETDDRLRVNVSNNCGDSWVLREIHRGITDLPTADPQNAPFVPEGDEWATGEATVDNPDYMVPGFRVQFDFEGRFGNHVYLDDININVFTADNVTVLDLVSGIEMTLAPNPADAFASLSYNMPMDHDVTIVMHDSFGKLIDTMYNGPAQRGENKLNINTAELASGVYLIRMQVGNEFISQRLIVR